MTRTAKPLGPQLKLVLMSTENASVVPTTSHELQAALIELLTTAACPPDVAREASGGDDDAEAHR